MINHQIFEYQLTIKESHLDSFGHVNNAVYLQLYEEARWDFITKNYMGLTVIQNNQKGPVLLDLKVKFKRELKNRQTIIIQSRVHEILNSKMIVLHQQMLTEAGKCASEAFFTVGYFDLRERKLIDGDSLWWQALGVEKK
jgi:YbgC/YbaW family acyl-CoA thioester hydrolase